MKKGKIAAVLALSACPTFPDNPCENATVLNYERVLQNRYATWEQELTEREAAVREKEVELLQEE